MDAETADCWMRFRREIEDAFRRHPDCAKQIGSTIEKAVDGLIRQAAAKGPETQQRLLDAAQAYNRLWRAGAVDSPEMVKVFVDLITWLRIAGIAPDSDQALAALRDSAVLAIDPRRADAARLRSANDGAAARGRRHPRWDRSKQGDDGLTFCKGASQWRAPT